MTFRLAILPILTLGLLTPTLKGPVAHSDFDYGDQPRELVLLGQNETSSGLASGAATPDGRSLLWKNRDRGGTFPNEFLFYDDGRIPFIGLTDNGNVNTCYGGMNIEGFALENTDAHNLVDHGPYNDGLEIREGLARCRTVDDFGAVLDSLDNAHPNGRYGHDYGVIDAYGGAAMYEAFRFGHRRYDAVDEVDGIIIRSNFAYEGLDRETNPSTYGLHRHNRSAELFRAAQRRGELTPLFIVQTVARDLTIDDFSPYPLPFDGYYGNYPYGVIDNNTAIGRSTTTATMIAQAVRAGERPDDGILWSMNGSPITAIMTPLWVRAGSVPREYDGPEYSRINRRAIELYNWVYLNGGVDTWKLVNPQGAGLWDFIFPLEQRMFAKTEQFLRSPQFSYDRLEAFQNEMAQQYADSLERWKPVYRVTEVIGEIYWANHLRLIWGVPDLGEDGQALLPRNYDVYRSDQPFREGIAGELVGQVAEPEFIDENPPEAGAFYQIIATF